MSNAQGRKSEVRVAAPRRAGRNLSKSGAVRGMPEQLSCPHCKSKSIEVNDSKAALKSAIGTIVLGLLLCLVFPPLLILLVLVGIYLVVSATRTKTSFECLECRHRWSPAGAVQKTAKDDEGDAAT